MSSISLNAALKYKNEPINIFDNNFLNEKDLALQPMNFIIDAENFLINDNINNKNLSLNTNIKERPKKKSLKESDLYDSNIIIVQEQSDDDESIPTSYNQIEKEVGKINKIIFITIMVILAVWFSAQYVVKDYFDLYISLSTFGVADQLFDFISKTLIEIFHHLPGIIMFFMPTIISIFFLKKINFEKYKLKHIIILLVLLLLFIGTYKLLLNVDKEKSYSNYNLYYEVNDISLNVHSFGIINSFYIDLKRAILGFEEKLVITDDDIIQEKPINDKEPVEITYCYNTLNIDFDSLLASESNNSIKEMHEYFKNDTGTLQNEYTGFFKGKNLILFMAESFNEIAVNEELTPTLYKLVNGGFSFDNFYTPTIFSTIGGEFQELTGLYAASAKTLSRFRSGEIYFPQGIANTFKKMNYNTYAYHDNSYVFQDRNKYLKSMGFDNFKACYNGLEKLINCKEWPQSDVAMITNTIDDYINDDNFMVFYASVSGHAGYTWASNAQAKKHKEELLAAGLNYSERPSAYIAAQMELDRALEFLINKLDEAGKLSDTVIALVGDHYPYELNLSEINEVSSYTKDAVVTVNKSNFILWNSEMDTIKVTKVGSQIDVMPTIYNVFGIEYDSRLFIGNDILSNTPGLAIFGNRSWVSDYGTYYSASKTFVPVDENEIADEYVTNMNKIVNNRITMSRLIIENNYYKKVL